MTYIRYDVLAVQHAALAQVASPVFVIDQVTPGRGSRLKIA